MNYPESIQTRFYCPLWEAIGYHLPSLSVCVCVWYTLWSAGIYIWRALTGLAQQLLKHHQVYMCRLNGRPSGHVDTWSVYLMVMLMMMMVQLWYRIKSVIFLWCEWSRLTVSSSLYNHLLPSWHLPTLGRAPWKWKWHLFDWTCLLCLDASQSLGNCRYKKKSNSLNALLQKYLGKWGSYQIQRKTLQESWLRTTEGSKTQSEEWDPVKHPDKVIRRQQTESARFNRGSGWVDLMDIWTLTLWRSRGSARLTTSMTDCASLGI